MPYKGSTWDEFLEWGVKGVYSKLNTSPLPAGGRGAMLFAPLPSAGEGLVLILGLQFVEKFVFLVEPT
jgi:hypothetical protein